MHECHETVYHAVGRLFEKSEELLAVKENYSSTYFEMATTVITIRYPNPLGTSNATLPELVLFFLD